MLYLVLAFFLPATEWSVNSEDLTNGLSNITSMAVTEQGEIYLLDHRRHLLYHIDADGREIGRIGRQGEGPGEFQRGEKLFYLPKDKKILLSDSNLMRMNIYELDGKPVRSFPESSEALFDAQYLSENRLAFIKVADALKDQKKGCSIVLKDLKTGAVTDLLHYNSEQHSDPHLAKAGGSVAYFEYPWDVKALLAKSWDGEYLFSGSNRTIDFSVIQVSTGKVVGKISDEAKKYSLEDAEIAADPQRLRIGGKAFSASSFQHTNYKPAVEGIFGDYSGRLWVRHNHPWEGEKTLYTVYDRNGSKVGSLEVPATETIIFANDDHYWGYFIDMKDEVAFIKKTKYAF